MDVDDSDATGLFAVRALEEARAIWIREAPLGFGATVGSFGLSTTHCALSTVWDRVDRRLFDASSSSFSTSGVFLTGLFNAVTGVFFNDERCFGSTRLVSSVFDWTRFRVDIRPTVGGVSGITALVLITVMSSFWVFVVSFTVDVDSFCSLSSCFSSTACFFLVDLVALFSADFNVETRLVDGVLADNDVNRVCFLAAVVVTADAVTAAGALVLSVLAIFLEYSKILLNCWKFIKLFYIVPFLLIFLNIGSRSLGEPESDPPSSSSLSSSLLRLFSFLFASCCDVVSVWPVFVVLLTLSNVWSPATPSFIKLITF